MHFARVGAGQIKLYWERDVRVLLGRWVSVIVSPLHATPLYLCSIQVVYTNARAAFCGRSVEQIKPLVTAM